MQSSKNMHYLFLTSIWQEIVFPGLLTVILPPPSCICSYIHSPIHPSISNLALLSQCSRDGFNGLHRLTYLGSVLEGKDHQISIRMSLFNFFAFPVIAFCWFNYWEKKKICHCIETHPLLCEEFFHEILYDDHHYCACRWLRNIMSLKKWV